VAESRENAAGITSDRSTGAGKQTTAPLENVRLSDTDRLEAFSDGVFAITITLLVFDIVRPDYEPGRLGERLLAQWPNYVAFLASFFYVGIIWLNHRAVFSRVRFCDRSLHLANLFLLPTSGLIPFPTALLSTALQRGSEVDAIVAVEIYAAIGGSMCLAWLALFHTLAIHPCVQEGLCRAGVFSAGTPSRLARNCTLCISRRNWRGLLAESRVVDFSGVAGVLRSHQRRPDRDPHRPPAAASWGRAASLGMVSVSATASAPGQAAMRFVAIAG
jgi:uncharacterized membrane protein